MCSVYDEGGYFWNQGKFADARSKLEAATRAYPNHADASYLLGQTMMKLGQDVDAIKPLETFLKLQPYDASCFTGRRWTPMVRRNPTTGRRHYRDQSPTLP